jgi:hypothetical protein
MDSIEIWKFGTDRVSYWTLLTPECETVTYEDTSSSYTRNCTSNDESVDVLSASTHGRSDFENENVAQ